MAEGLGDFPVQPLNLCDVPFAFSKLLIFADETGLRAPVGALAFDVQVLGCVVLLDEGCGVWVYSAHQDHGISRSRDGRKRGDVAGNNSRRRDRGRARKHRCLLKLVLDSTSSSPSAPSSEAQHHSPGFKTQHYRYVVSAASHS